MSENSEFDVAIVGMAGRFPGARDTDAYWRNLAAGVESITRLSDAEILESGASPALLDNPSYVRAAPVLDEPGHFDAAFFGYSPAEARAMDPQHRLLLELAYEALEDAGYDPNRAPGRVGVFTGSALNTYYSAQGLSTRLTDDYIPTLIGNDKDFLSTRVSYKLNLRGPSMTVQTACSTSLVAVHLARQSLLSLESDMALAGAVSVRVPHRAGYVCDGGGVVSPDGHVRAFDAKANGTVFGSGGGIIVLKRLEDALADGDVIRAVIKGSAVNNDGSGKAGYTAPSVTSQADAVVEALANAGVEADTVGYVEAHGSGTPVGDPIELAALSKAFRASTQRTGFCAIGSAKSNIGHLDAAAGVAGLIKAVLALEHRQLPPTVHFTEPNPEIDFPRTPFFVNAELREWPSAGPRRAGVMATGMGGTNAHVVLEEAPERGARGSKAPPLVAREEEAAPKEHLLVWSARTAGALDATTARLREHLCAHDGIRMDDVELTLQVGRREMPHRRCLVCTGREDAIAALDAPGRRVQSGIADDTRRKVVLLLPGIGDQYVGMAHGLYERFPVFRDEVDRCAALLEPHIGTDIRQVLYPEDGSWKRATQRRGIDLRQMLGRSDAAPADPHTVTLNQTRFAHGALFTVEYAMTRLWQSLGVTPDVIVGHSMGEYVAACIAGVMSLGDALRLVAIRARLVSALPQGAMLAVTLSEAEVLDVLPESLSIALINGPNLCVVAGSPDDVARFERDLTARGVICRAVQNAHAFHSRLMEPIVRDFEAEMRRVQLRPPTIPYISNVTGTWITAAQATSVAYWASHATRTARFNDALRALWQVEDALLVEAGPGRTLSVLATQHPDRPLGGEPMVASALRHSYDRESDVGVLYKAVGRAWLGGARIQWDSLRDSAAAMCMRVRLPTYPFERERHWLEPVRSATAAAAAAPSAVRKTERMSEWLYAPSWKRSLARPFAERVHEAPPADARPWLAFVDDVGLARGVIVKLRQAGHDVVTVRAGAGFENPDPHSFVIDPSCAEHYDRVLRALHATRSVPDRIIHAWSVTDAATAEPDVRAFACAQDAGFYGLVHLVRALATNGVRHEIALFVLSNHVHEVTGDEALHADKATVLGPCLVIRQEYPNVRVRNIDVDAPARAVASGSAADLVTGELLSVEPNLFVAYRHGQRWVQTYERVAPDTVTRAAPFRERGVYLITGGLGRIGTAIAEYLAATYAARLVLVGRSASPDRNTIRRIEELGGEVLYVVANVSDVDAMRNAVTRARATFCTLHGVIHAAGLVSDDGSRDIDAIDRDLCERHFEGKAHGLRALERVLDDVPLDFCLLMSSMASVLGGIGQAAYAAANIYMDVFARVHNRTRRMSWLSVNWDVWRLDPATETALGRGATLKDLGMTAAESMSMLERVLPMSQAGQLVVSTGDLHARIDQWVKLEAPKHDSATASAGARAALSERPDLRAAYDAPRDDTERRIATIWQDTLGIRTIGINDSFADVGGHSLLAVRIVAELRSAFQVDLPMRALFDAPTVAELADLIRTRLLAEIDALSDEEARRLVSSVG